MYSTDHCYHDLQGNTRLSKFILCQGCGQIVRTGSMHYCGPNYRTMVVICDDTDPIVKADGNGQ